MKEKQRNEDAKRIVIIGFGQRGQNYTGYAMRHPLQFKIVAVVDTDEEKLATAQKLCACPTFSNLDDYFNAAIVADAAVVAVQDSDHVAVTVACMNRGLDILLEKPIACSMQECNMLEKKAQSSGSKVLVCHVLRYTPFYNAVKRAIDDGVLGDVITVHTSENVGYWHQAHSFVRGPWKSSAKSTPMIVAKCCHDMDILRWLIDKKPMRVASFGELTHFKKENAPKDCAEYCSKCNVTDCEYRAQKLYLKRKWCASYFLGDKEKTDENILSALAGTEYDRCVYLCDNDVVDHQVTIINFESGITAEHMMTAFSKDCYRTIAVHGTKAELVGTFEENRFEIRPFGGEPYFIEIGKQSSGHGGGDDGIMEHFYTMLSNDGKDEAYLSASLDSHKMAFGAELSRLSGKIVEL